MTYKGITLPDNIREFALKSVKNIIDQFNKEGKLNNLDQVAIYMLANNFNTYLECEEHIKEEGLIFISDRGNKSLSPYAIQQKVVQSQIAVLLKELGLTLSSRNKMKLIANEVEESPLANFIRMNE